MTDDVRQRMSVRVPEPERLPQRRLGVAEPLDREAASDDQQEREQR